MKKQESWTYENIVYLLSLFLLLTSFLTIQDKLQEALFDFFYNLVFILTITIAFLWKRTRIIFIALIIFLLSWNIDLLIFPLFQIKNELFLQLNLFQYNKILHIAAFICLILGLFNWVKNDYLKESMSISNTNLIYLIAGSTFIIQVITRYI